MKITFKYILADYQILARSYLIEEHRVMYIEM